MRYRQYTCSLIKDLYVANHFINHAASLHQTFVHCGKFLTAATRRCMGRVSVPSVGVRLSPPLDVIAMVSHYLTIKLISHRPFPERKTLLRRDYRVLAHLSVRYSRLGGTYLCITTSSATNQRPSSKYCFVLYCYSTLLYRSEEQGSFDLHALSTPPAFILS
jgi:hypothetical protein